MNLLAGGLWLRLWLLSHECATWAENRKNRLHLVPARLSALVGIAAKVEPAFFWR